VLFRKIFLGFWTLDFGLSLEEIVPYVNIKITKDGATPEQKEALIKGVTKLLGDVLDKNPATTMVVIDEVETDNWGIGGESVTKRREGV
jgi:4-oxalocrotonate tautomerase